MCVRFFIFLYDDVERVPECLRGEGVALWLNISLYLRPRL
nr:MAG TPA: hypothetical protein [Microviridae sp.]